MSDPESLRERCWWYTYSGKPVFVQLREPYVGVTYPNMPIIAHQQTERGMVETAVYVPFLRGILHVKSEGGPDSRPLLIVETVDPNPDGEGAAAFIVIHPEDVLYMTHIEQKKLVQA